MKGDLVYRDLMQTHAHGEATEIDVLSETQWEESRGNAQKAIHCVEERMRREDYHQLHNQLDRTMTKMLLAKMDVAEFYSPQRVTRIAEAMGLKAGWSLVLTTQDHDGRAWGFNDIVVALVVVSIILIIQAA